MCVCVCIFSLLYTYTFKTLAHILPPLFQCRAFLLRSSDNNAFLLPFSSPLFHKATSKFATCHIPASSTYQPPIFAETKRVNLFCTFLCCSSFIKTLQVLICVAPLFHPFQASLDVSAFQFLLSFKHVSLTFLPLQKHVTCFLSLVHDFFKFSSTNQSRESHT